MRKLIRNPVKLKLERPNYKKFRVADLGINIIENPRGPREHTIMESAVQMNPVYRSRFDPRGLDKGAKILVMIFSQNISGNPYICFSDGEREACLPTQFQMTQSILSRMILKSGRKAREVQDEISSKGNSKLYLLESDFESVLIDSGKYGKIMETKRDIEKESYSESPDLIDCSESLAFRYLATSLSIR